MRRRLTVNAGTMPIRTVIAKTRTRISPDLHGPEEWHREHSLEGDLGAVVEFPRLADRQHRRVDVDDVEGAVGDLFGAHAVYRLGLAVVQTRVTAVAHEHEAGIVEIRGNRRRERRVVGEPSA